MWRATSGSEVEAKMSLWSYMHVSEVHEGALHLPRVLRDLRELLQGARPLAGSTA